MSQVIDLPGGNVGKPQGRYAFFKPVHEIIEGWDISMAFVSEFTFPGDIAGYDIFSIDSKFLVGETGARDWVIDRDREIYLRNVAHGGGGEYEVRNQIQWNFYWLGELLTLRIDMLESGGKRDGTDWSRWMLIWINGGKGLPAHLKSDAPQFIEDLGLALTAHKGFGGVHSKYTRYDARIEIAKGCVI
ncbi:hypothetical protein [Xanthomonas campestris]|nr:hypothetical protein [Xanthomonas campestris]MEA9905100.1 hypothetical protein [Xanthomonas campestris pv. raphani]